MDVRERLTYNPALESAAIGPSSRLGTEQRSSSPASVPATTADSSTLSSASRSVAQVLSLPEVRQERVSQLQQQINSGTYHVDPQDVADAMLHSLRG